MKKLILASGLLLLLTVTACQSKHKQGSGNLEHKTLTDSSIVKIIPEYAQGFKITYTDQACLLDIQDPQNKESQSFHYALVPRGVEAENIPADYTVIETPIRSVICMTSLQLSNFIKLEELDAVVGITSTRHLFNKKINDRLKEGSIHKIGIEGNFDNEVIMSVNPDLILPKLYVHPPRIIHRQHQQSALSAGHRREQAHPVQYVAGNRLSHACQPSGDICTSIRTLPAGVSILV